MLRVSLLGNLGADPETRTSQKGSPMTTFRVAVNQLRTDGDGERQENTEWFRVRAMGRLAESSQRLAKGGRVLVVGRLDISHYQARDGEPRVGFDVWADEVINLGGRAVMDATSGPVDVPTGPATAKTARWVVGAPQSPEPEESEDLPF